MTDLDEQIARIGAKLLHARTANVGGFGTGSHQFLLAPPLDESEVRAFEARHGVTLPDGYRAFITRLGHGGPGEFGGAGPYYGLFALDAWSDFLACIADDCPLDWLARPSPLHPGANPLPEFTDDTDPDTEWPGPAVLGMYEGILSLGTRGCSFATGLIVSGDARGRVVYLDADHGEPPYVGRDADFLDWYERWLDELTAGFGGSWFGYGPAGGEPELLAVVTGSSDRELRIEAIHNLSKLPNLSAGAFEVLAGLLRSGAATERGAAAAVFNRAPANLVEAVVPLLDDDDAKARGSACRALVEVDPHTWSERLWAQLLREPATEVQNEVYIGLKRAGLLDEQRAMTLVSTPEFGDLRAWAAELVTWRPEHAPLLHDMLASEHISVRRCAATALDVLGLEASVPIALERFATERDDGTRAALIRMLVAAREHRVCDLLLHAATDGSDFERLEAVRVLVAFGDERVEASVRELLIVDRPPSEPGKWHSKTFAELLGPNLDVSPSPKLRALSKGV